MDKKELSQLIIEELGSIENTINILDELLELSTEIVKGMRYEEDSKVRVLNLLMLNAYKSLNTFKTLLHHDHFNDAFLLTRKIVEILIRIEYLSKTNTFDNYFRERSIEQAKILHSLINSHPIKHVSQTALWKIRTEIIQECKLIYQDQLSGGFVNTPNVEQMAERTGMLFLYKNTYGALSKFVHSNMSIENFYIYKLNNKISYHTEGTDNNIKMESVKTTIDETLYCFYQIIVKYCSELDVFKERIESFNNKFFLFVSMDLVTGRSKSNVDMGISLIKHLTGSDITKEEDDLEHEVVFVDDDVSALKASWTKLEALINQKESELENL